MNFLLEGVSIECRSSTRPDLYPCSVTAFNDGEIAPRIHNYQKLLTSWPKSRNNRLLVGITTDKSLHDGFVDLDKVQSLLYNSMSQASPLHTGILLPYVRDPAKLMRV